MKMSDVTIGMRLRNPKYAITDTTWGAEIIVTEITERGFKYERVDGKDICIHLRLGIWLGHSGEHYGYNGETDYEEVKYNPVEEARIKDIDIKIEALQVELKSLFEERQKYGEPALVTMRQFTYTTYSNGNECL